MGKQFNTLRGITIASALSGNDKQELLEFINRIERSMAENDRTDGKGLDR